MYKRRRSAGVVLALVAVLSALSGGVALAAEGTTPPKVMEPYALELLKKMSDKLAAAKSLAFRTRDTVEAPGGTGQFLNFFAESQVMVERPNKLMAKIAGDAPPFDFYYDGSKMVVYAPTQKLYAATEAPGTIDELLPFAVKKAGIILPFDDVLYSDPYTVLTKDLTSAFYAGYSNFHGHRCEHLAFASAGLQWQIWINDKTLLPCLMMGTMLDVQGAPRFAVEFSHWRLDQKFSPKQFSLTKPEGAGEMEFGTMAHQLTHSQGEAE
jgi:hypothetical protein